MRIVLIFSQLVFFCEISKTQEARVKHTTHAKTTAKSFEKTQRSGLHPPTHRVRRELLQLVQLAAADPGPLESAAGLSREGSPGRGSLPPEVPFEMAVRGLLDLPVHEVHKGKDLGPGQVLGPALGHHREEDLDPALALGVQPDDAELLEAGDPAQVGVGELRREVRQAGLQEAHELLGGGVEVARRGGTRVAQGVGLALREAR